MARHFRGQRRRTRQARDDPTARFLVTRGIAMATRQHLVFINSIFPRQFLRMALMPSLLLLAAIFAGTTALVSVVAAPPEVAQDDEQKAEKEADSLKSKA